LNGRWKIWTVVEKFERSVQVSERLSEELNRDHKIWTLEWQMLTVPVENLP
jgi:hypothetical protein